MAFNQHNISYYVCGCQLHTIKLCFQFRKKLQNCAGFLRQSPFAGKALLFMVRFLLCMFQTLAVSVCPVVCISMAFSEGIYSALHDFLCVGE